MRLLLDTHTFMWFVNGDAELHSHARGLIEDTENERWLSIGSLWEMAIKASLGKLVVGPAFTEIVRTQVAGNAISLLPVQPSHLDTVKTLPLHHRDPFDRLLIAQALVEGLDVVGRDQAFDGYAIRRHWAG